MSGPVPTPRPDLLERLEHEFPGARVEPMIGDASTRVFLRLHVPSGETRVVMDYGRPFEGETDDMRLARVFRAASLPVAAIERALADDERPDSIRIAEGDDAMTNDQRNDRVAALAALMKGIDRVEHLLRRQVAVRADLQLVREHIQQYLGIRVGAQVAPVLPGQELGQLVMVGQVAVMREADAIRRIHVERLRFGGLGTARGRIPNMADADVPGQSQHMPVPEYVAH